MEDGPGGFEVELVVAEVDGGFFAIEGGADESVGLVLVAVLAGEEGAIDEFHGFVVEGFGGCHFLGSLRWWDRLMARLSWGDDFSGVLSGLLALVTYFLLSPKAHPTLYLLGSIELLLLLALAREITHYADLKPTPPPQPQP
jgi:hypothetical protein